uniref:BLOC-1-related complex subunit 5 n=1 Tax=Meloidogyne floridensis TaxID=298350 RepID=A0A915NVL5_9BILA
MTKFFSIAVQLRAFDRVHEIYQQTNQLYAQINEEITRQARERIGYLNQSLNDLVAHVGSIAPENLVQQAYALNQEHVDFSNIVVDLGVLQHNELQNVN